MSADQITQERIAELRERAATGGPENAWRRSDYLAVLDALTTSRAEVQRLTEEARRSDAGRLEVPELTDADLPHPGKVRPGSYSWQRNKLFSEGYNLARHRSRLPPSPQPATGADTPIAWCIRDKTSGLLWDYSRSAPYLEDAKRRSASPEKWEILPLYERPYPQPSADVVVVPREEWQLVNACLSTRRAIDRCDKVEQDVRLHQRMARLEIKLDAIRATKRNNRETP